MSPTMFLRAILLSLSLILLSATAQQAVPFASTGDPVVIDATGNQLFRFMDLNLDGDWNDAGEIVLFFFTATGITLGNPANLAVGPDGAVYVADTTNDQIVRLQDLDGDGVATSAGEASVYFSSAGNGSGVLLPTPLGLTVDANSVVWVTNAGTSGGGNDAVIRLADGNGNLDCQDAGEAIEYATFFPGQSTGFSNPSNVVVGSDAAVYYMDNGTGTKTLFRLHDDVVPNGVCTDAGEVTAFFTPTPPAPTPAAQYWGITSDQNGGFYITDSAYDRVLRVNDLNLDLVITLGAPEEKVFYDATVTPSNFWTSAVASDGSLFLVEDGGTGVGDRLIRLVDGDLDGNANGGGEATIVYDDTIASVNVGSIRSIAFLKAPRIDAIPNPVAIGTSVTIRQEAAAFDLMNVWASLFTDSLLAPPYGTVGISIAIPGAFFELITPFTLDATGVSNLVETVPNDPNLIGGTFHLQAIGGPPARLRLSNVIGVTFF